MPHDKEFAKMLEFSKSVDRRIADDPNFKGEAPESKPMSSLLPLEEDEFGGNDNNRRVAKREAKERKVVKGEAKIEELKQTLKENAADVSKEQAKESTPKTGDDSYPAFSQDGRQVWKPNS